MANEVPKTIKKRFLDLESNLSPENLSCDGELPVSQQRSRERKFLAEWRKLEALIGRKVELEGDETFSWWQEEFNKD